MKTKIIMTRAALSFSAMLIASTAFASADGLLSDYQNAGAGPFSAEAGAAAWQKKHSADSQPTERSCSLCHGTDLSQPGKHAKTGKAIKPMSTAANPERLSDPKKTEKWFRRNCRWTLGRECTAQEKGDFVRFFNQ